MSRRYAGAGCKGFGKGLLYGVAAEAVLRGILEEGFGVHGAVEMHVQVGALGHRLEEGVERRRASASGGVEGCGGTGFGGKLRMQRCEAEQEGEQDFVRHQAILEQPGRKLREQFRA